LVHQLLGPVVQYLTLPVLDPVALFQEFISCALHHLQAKPGSREFTSGLFVLLPVQILVKHFAQP
jgi:hypothetical protein